MTAILVPGYIQVIEKTADGWFQTKPTSVVNFSDRAFDCLNKEKYYGLTKAQIVTELFKKYQGKLGFYIVNLDRHQYYYCGLTVNDIKEKLVDLGVLKIG